MTSFFLETVGVGQSELRAVDMVDIFIVVTIPGAGDELQGIKRGIVEMADMILVNKTDSNDKVSVDVAVNDYKTSLHLLHSKDAPPVFAVSALKGTGLSDILPELHKHQKSGLRNEKRTEQKTKWLLELIEKNILDEKIHNPKSQEILAKLKAQIRSGDLSPIEAAEKFFENT